VIIDGLVWLHPRRELEQWRQRWRPDVEFEQWPWQHEQQHRFPCLSG